MKVKHKILTGISVSIIAVILTPLIVDHWIIGNEIQSNITNEQWVSFLGSYLGAILSSIVSIAGVVLTIKYYIDKDKQEKAEKNKLILDQLKKEYELKYRFEYLEALDCLYRALETSSNMFLVFTTNIIASLKDWDDDFINEQFKNLKKEAENLKESYFNLDRIYKVKIGIFEKSERGVKLLSNINKFYLILECACLYWSGNNYKDKRDFIISVVFFANQLNKGVKDVSNIYNFAKEIKSECASLIDENKKVISC